MDSNRHDPRRSLVAAALAAALAAAAHADVFVRLPRTGSGAMEALGGARVESTSIDVNGAQGTLRVYAFDLSAAELLAAVNRELRRLRPGEPGETGLWIDWGRRAGNAGDRTSVLLLVPCGSAGAAQCLAFAIEASAPGEALWPWDDLAAPADFGTTFSALLDKGRAGFAAGTTALAPDAARAAWSAALAAAGWVAASPAPDATSLALYAREGETLSLLVLPAEEEGNAGGSRVAVTRRRPR